MDRATICGQHHSMIENTPNQAVEATQRGKASRSCKVGLGRDDGGRYTDERWLCIAGPLRPLSILLDGRPEEVVAALALETERLSCATRLVDVPRHDRR